MTFRDYRIFSIVVYNDFSTLIILPGSCLLGFPSVATILPIPTGYKNWVLVKVYYLGPPMNLFKQTVRPMKFKQSANQIYARMINKAKR